MRKRRISLLRLTGGGASFPPLQSGGGPGWGQVGEAIATQLDASKAVERSFADELGRIGGSGERFVARVRLEIRESQLDPDRGCAQPVVAQILRHVARELCKHLCHRLPVGRVALKRVLPAALLGLPVRDRGPLVDVCRLVQEVPVGLAEKPEEPLERNRRKIAHCDDAELLEALFGLGPTPGTLRTGSGQIFASRSPAPMLVSPSGFCRSEAILARRLFCAMPIEHVSPVSSRMQRLMSLASASVDCSDAVASR